MFHSYTSIFYFMFLLSLTWALELKPSPKNDLSEKTLRYDRGFTKIGSKYYYFEIGMEKNWFEAYQACRQMGADLITFNRAEEFDAITKYLRRNALLYDYWTSGTDLQKTGRHIWFSNGHSIDLTIWHSGEPNNDKGREHCDELRYTRDKLALNDYRCDVRSRYICELPTSCRFQ